jgi:acid phosphatase type 7
VEFIHSDDGAAHDAFTISRDYKDVLACTVDSCAPHTMAS